MLINATYRTWIQRICELQPKQRHRFHVLRQKGNSGLWRKEQIGWWRMDEIVQCAGQSTWCPQAHLTQQEIHPVSALIYCQIGEKQP